MLATLFLVMVIPHQAQCMQNNALAKSLRRGDITLAKKILKCVHYPPRIRISHSLLAANQAEKELQKERKTILVALCELRSPQLILNKLFNDEVTKNAFKQWFHRTVDQIPLEELCELYLHHKKNKIYKQPLTKERFCIYLLRLTQTERMKEQFVRLIHTIPTSCINNKAGGWKDLKKESIRDKNPTYLCEVTKIEGDLQKKADLETRIKNCSPDDMLTILTQKKVIWPCP